MYTAIILLGSNMGDRLAYLEQAKEWIVKQCGSVVKQSGIYETAAWGTVEQPSFYNQVMVIETELLPAILMQTLLVIEEKLGRKRTIKYGPRTIDLDILFINNLIINTDILILPHPFLHERRFTLLPLAEIAPTLVHPIKKVTVQQLLLDCTDTLEVKKLD